MRYIKAIVVVVYILVFSTQTLHTQIVKSEYFMRTSYMRTYLNPAFSPYQGQLVLPVLPNIGANIQTNSINLDHLTFRRDGRRVTFIHPSVSNESFLKNIAQDNYARADVNYKIFALGLFINDRYTNFDIGLRVNADVNLPRSIFELLKVGFDQDKPTKYDLKDISATAQAYVEFGVSQSRSFLDNSLTLGARTKLLLGAGYIDLNAKSFDLTAGPEEWRSISQVTLRGAAPGVRPKFNNKDQLDSFDFSWDGIPGYGFGLDVGAVYDLGRVVPVLNGLKLSAAVNDIGFIRWTASNSLNMSSSREEIVINPSSINEENIDKSIKDIFDDAFDDLQRAVDLQEVGSRKGRSTSLRATMLVGAEYELLEDKLSLGALYSARFGNYYTAHEMTISANYQPQHWLGVTGSYSFVHSKFNTFGFALHVAPQRGVTFFLASDYIIPHVSTQFLPTSSKGLNLQLGFSIPIGRVVSSNL